MSLDMQKNKCLIYGLLAVLVLNMLCADTSAKILFCKNCRATRSTADPSVSTVENTTINTGNIIRAPIKCRAGTVPDRKGTCRKLVSNQSTGEMKIHYKFTVLRFKCSLLLAKITTICLHYLGVCRLTQECKHLLGELRHVLTKLVFSLAH